MAYNTTYPMGYQPSYYQNPQAGYPAYQPPVQPTPQQAQNNGITWVQGEAGAKSYLVVPNTTVQLWDSEAQTIYLKSADASGMPTMKTLDYVIREAQAANTSTLMQDTLPEYVTKDEFSVFADKVQKQLEKVSKRRREVSEDDE